MIGLMFIVGCAEKVNNNEPITSGDDSYTMDEPVEQISDGFGSDYNSKIRFEEKSTLGRGDHIVVKKLGRVGPNHSQYERLKDRLVLITIGWISKGSDGVYRYYEPITNELNPTFTETDLTVLKTKIKAHRSNP
ncbi:MAG: hypothetical protein WC374_05445 [Phycisphaerae bacterium]|jgi:hypothetical protein